MVVRVVWHLPDLFALLLAWFRTHRHPLLVLWIGSQVACRPMATREYVELVCDLCGRVTNDVETRRPLDGRVELEACERCWKKPREVVETVAAAGRTVRRPKQQQRKRKTAAQ